MQTERIIEQMFRIGDDLAEKVVARTNSLTARDEEEWAYKGAMFFFFCKAYKSYQAIRVLWREGFAEDAFILARTIFELALQTRYMREDPKPRARLFAEHDPVMRYRYYLRLKKLGDAKLVQRIERNTQGLEELKRNYDRLQAKYPDNKGWWGQSIACLAKHLGKEMETRYVMIYWRQSNLTHSGSTSVKEYINEEQGGLKAKCYPSPSDTAMIPQEATRSFLDIVELAAEALGLNLHTEVGNALAQFRNTVDAN